MGRTSGEGGEAAVATVGRRGMRRLLSWSGWIVAGLLVIVVGVQAGMEATPSDDGRVAQLEEDLRNAEDLAEDQAQQITQLQSQIEDLRAADETEPDEPASEPSPEQSPEPATDVVQTFRGSGIESTRPFSIGDEWEVRWRAEGVVFQIYLYTRGGELVNIIANQECPCRGSSFQAQGGSYYLETNGDGSWTIEVADI